MTQQSLILLNVSIKSEIGHSAQSFLTLLTFQQLNFDWEERCSKEALTLTHRKLFRKQAFQCVHENSCSKTFRLFQGTRLQ